MEVEVSETLLAGNHLPGMSPPSHTALLRLIAMEKNYTYNIDHFHINNIHSPPAEINPQLVDELRYSWLKIIGRDSLVAEASGSMSL